MNKKLITLAIAAALTAPMAASAAPTVYGKLHLSFGSVNQDYDATSTSTDVDNWQVRSHFSRLGFKGSEEMGNGLTAKYQIEYGIAPVDTTTDAGLSQRNQWLGLAGGFGEVRIGRHDTPTKISQGKFDVFGDTDADIKGTLSMVQGDIRADNAIAYISPKIANSLTIAAAIIPGEETGTGAAVDDGIADSVSIAAMYGAGPLYIGLGHDSFDADQGSSALDTITRLTATYKMGAMQFGLIYETGDDEGGNVGDKDVMGGSFKFTMGKNAMKVQYLTAETETAVGTANTDDTKLALGVDHMMSKNTTAYFMYTTAEHDAASTTSDYDYTAMTVGMVHNF